MIGLFLRLFLIHSRIKDEVRGVVGTFFDKKRIQSLS